jgi:hypothetical protein
MPARRPFFGNVARVSSFQWMMLGLLLFVLVGAVMLVRTHSGAGRDFKSACDGIAVGMNADVADRRFSCPPARWLRIGTLHRWWLTYTLAVSRQDVCDFQIDARQNVVSVKYEIKHDL